MRERRSAAGTAAAVVVGLVAVSLLVRLGRHDQFTIDTVLLVRGVDIGLDCLGNGIFDACAFDPETNGSAVGPYPLLQYLPTLLFVALDLSERTVLQLLAWLNAAAILVSVAVVTQFARRRGRGVAAFAVFAMVSGMLVSYAGATVGEPLAMLALLVTCRLAIAERPTLWLGIATAVAVIGKETLVPVVVLYGAAFVLMSAAQGRIARHKAWLIAGGALVGVVANAALNVFRFGSLRNVAYLEVARRPEPVMAAKSAVSLFVSPNGGVLWFWWAAFVALAFLAWTLGRKLVGGWAPTDRPWRDRSTVSLVLLLAGFATGVASLALWWMPFGWYSWGPRLLVPFVPPLFLAAVVYLPTRRRSTAVTAGAVTAVAFLLLIPNWAFVFSTDRWMSHWLATVAERPECLTVDLRDAEGAAVHHHCVVRAAWRTSSMPMIEAVDGASDRDPVWFWTTVGGAGLGASAMALALRSRRSLDQGPVPVDDDTYAATGSTLGINRGRLDSR